MAKHKNKKQKSGKVNKSARRKRLQKLLPVLQSVHKAAPKHRATLLSHLDSGSRQGIYEAINNVLHNPAIPRERQLMLKKKLHPYKKDLRYLADSSKSNKNRQKRLSRMGGFPWETILSTAVPLLMALL